MKKAFVISALLLALLPCVAQVKPTQKKVAPKTVLSADLKQTLLAAADPTATDADIRVYIRSARVQVRTTKDKVVFAKLVEFVRLLDEAQEYETTLNHSHEEDVICIHYETYDYYSSDFDTSILNPRLLERFRSDKEADKKYPTYQLSYTASDRAKRRDDCKAEFQINQQIAIGKVRLATDIKEDLDAAKLLFADFRSDLGLN